MYDAPSLSFSFNFPPHVVKRTNSEAPNCIVSTHPLLFPPSWTPLQAVPNFCTHLNPESGPGTSVRIATDYGLDGPGSNPGGDEIF